MDKSSHTYYREGLAKLERIGQMLKEVDIVFSRSGEGQVGNRKSFCSPVLYSDLVKIIAFGGDDNLGSSYSAIFAHDAFWFGLRWIPALKVLDAKPFKRIFRIISYPEGYLDNRSKISRL